MFIPFDLQELISSLTSKTLYPLTDTLPSVLCEYILNWWRGEKKHTCTVTYLEGGTHHHWSYIPHKAHSSCSALPRWPFHQYVSSSKLLGKEEPCTWRPFFWLQGHTGAFWLTFLLLTGEHLLQGLCVTLNSPLLPQGLQLAQVRRHQCPAPSLPRLFLNHQLAASSLADSGPSPTAADRGVIRWFMLTTINRAHYFPGNRQDDGPACLLFPGHNWFFFATLSGSRLNHIDVSSSKWCLWCLVWWQIKYGSQNPEHATYPFPGTERSSWHGRKRRCVHTCGVVIDTYLCFTSVWECGFPPSIYVSVIFIIYPHCLSGIQQEGFTRSSSLWSLPEGCWTKCFKCICIGWVEWTVGLVRIGS